MGSLTTASAACSTGADPVPFSAHDQQHVPGQIGIPRPLFADILGDHEADVVVFCSGEHGFGCGVNHGNEPVRSHAGAADGAPFFMGLADVQDDGVCTRNLGCPNGKTEVGGVFHAVEKPDATAGGHHLVERIVLRASGQRQRDLSAVG